MLSRRSTPAPFRRSKRAAAAAAESKIKKFIQDIDRDDDQVTKGKASPRMIQLMANDISFAPDNLNPWRDTYVQHGSLRGRTSFSDVEAVPSRLKARLSVRMKMKNKWLEWLGWNRCLR